MKYKLFSLLLSLCLSVPIASLAQERTNQEIAEIARRAFEERHKVRFDTEIAIKTLKSGMESLSDAEKIRAIYQILIDHDKNSKLRMGMSVGYIELSALSETPNLITDYTELKKMLLASQDPREFYLLARMIPRPTKENKHNFIPEIAHMLFQDGRVFRTGGEYMEEYSDDVSKYAYYRICNILRAYGQMFQPAEGLTHDQEVLSLATWLKENWPGCENIKIPPHLLGENSRSRIRRSVVKAEKKKLPRKATIPAKESNKINDSKEIRLPWVIAGGLLVGIALLCLKSWISSRQ